VHVLVVQHEDDRQASEIGEICASAGLAPFPELHPVVANLWFEGFERGIFSRERRVTCWQITTESSGRTDDEQTPVEIERVLALIRQRIPRSRSMSGTFPLDDDGEDPWQSPEAFEGVLRAQLSSDPDGKVAAALTEVLIARGELDEAFDFSVRSIAGNPHDPERWAARGRIQMRQEQFGPAAEAFERALELDPLHRMSLVFLSHCLDKLGQPDRANATRARARALGAPI
jgi:tetratricopeptide (TPR) repeat protein